MDQLLDIRSVPIKVEINITRAQLKPMKDTPSVNASSMDNGVIQLKADSFQMNVNSFQGAPAVDKNTDTFTISGDDSMLTLTYEGIARFVQGTAGEDDTYSDGPKVSFNTQKATRTIESVLESISKSNSNVKYSEGALKVNYAANQSSFDWDKINAPGFEFIPGSIEFVISEMPRLDIEYLGKPIYFPRSADPNYEPLIDINA